MEPAVRKRLQLGINWIDRAMLVKMFLVGSGLVWGLLAFIMFFFVYFYGVRIGSRSMDLLGSLIAILVVEEFVLIEPGMIWSKYLILNYGTLVHDMNEVFRHFMVHSKIILMRKSGVIKHANDFIQHFNVACRAARSYPHLPMARFLLLLNDFDIPLQVNVFELYEGNMFRVCLSHYLPRMLAAMYYYPVAPLNTWMLWLMNIVWINGVAYLSYYSVSGRWFSWYYGFIVIGVILLLLFGWIPISFYSIRREKKANEVRANRLMFKDRSSAIYEKALSKSMKGKSSKSKKSTKSALELMNEQEDNLLFTESSQKAIGRFGKGGTTSGKVNINKVLPAELIPNTPLWINRDLHSSQLFTIPENNFANSKLHSRDDFDEEYDDFQNIEDVYRSQETAEEFEKNLKINQSNLFLMFDQSEKKAVNLPVQSAPWSDVNEGGVQDRPISIISPGTPMMSTSMRKNEDLIFPSLSEQIVAYENQKRELFDLSVLSKPLPKIEGPPLASSGERVAGNPVPSKSIYFQDQYDPIGGFIPMETSMIGSRQTKSVENNPYEEILPFKHTLPLPVSAKDRHFKYPEEEKEDFNPNEYGRFYDRFSQNRSQFQDMQSDYKPNRSKSSPGFRGNSSPERKRSPYKLGSSTQKLSKEEEEWNHSKSKRKSRRERFRYYIENPHKVRPDTSSGKNNGKEDSPPEKRAPKAPKENYVFRKYSGRIRRREGRLTNHFSQEPGHIGPGALAAKELQELDERNQRSLALLMMPYDQNLSIMDIIGMLPNSYQENIDRLERSDAERRPNGGPGSLAYTMTTTPPSRGREGGRVRVGSTDKPQQKEGEETSKEGK